jgi:hypothetical protein
LAKKKIEINKYKPISAPLLKGNSKDKNRHLDPVARRFLVHVILETQCAKFSL